MEAARPSLPPVALATPTAGPAAPRARRAAWTLLASLALFAASGPLPSPASARQASAVTQDSTVANGIELYDVERVVDGDTIHIIKGGERVKLRLLSVDTEEKLTGRPNVAPTKPETVFGEASAQWAKAFFEELAEPGQPPRVGLRFPDGIERNDVYGRLLCHVLLPDGSDFNVKLVREGWSPYFNKYGNSRLAHEEFVEAQRLARKEQLGIWNPGTNSPVDPSAPSAKRPYAALLPWWNARAEAIENFRERHAENPIKFVDAEDPENLELAAFAVGAGARVEVFGSIFRVFDEDDGTTTLLMRTGEPDRALRVSIPANHREALEDLRLTQRAEDEFLQNYLWIAGEVRRRDDGSFRMELRDLEQLRVAGPEPEYGPPALIELHELGIDVARLPIEPQR
jgi:micrococcal nuclease